jgi:hypothetical protein
MNELAMNEAMARGARAEALMRSELLIEARDELIKTYEAAWRATKPSETEGREKLWQAVQIVGKVWDHLESVAANGKVAQADLNALLKDEARKKRLGIF